MRAPGVLNAADLFRGEPEADELHRGGLALRAGIFTGRVRFAADAEPSGFDERAVFDAAELHQSPGAALRVVDFEHHRRVELAALRDQRVVGRQLVGDLVVAAFLDIEHLVDMAPHRREILEIECRERPDLEAAALFQLGDLAPALAADLEVFLELQQRAGEPVVAVARPIGERRNKVGVLTVAIGLAELAARP